MKVFETNSVTWLRCDMTQMSLPFRERFFSSSIAISPVAALAAPE
jgi:hypothetical protein